MKRGDLIKYRWLYSEEDLSYGVIIKRKNDMNFGSIIHVLSDSCEIECLPESMIIIERVKNNEHKNINIS